MFRKLKMYLIVAVILAATVLLILNKFLVYGLIVFGVGMAAVALYHVFIKQKDDEIYKLRSQLKETDKTATSLKSENTELRNRKLNVSEIKSAVDLGLMEVNATFTRVWNDKMDQDNKKLRFIGALQVGIVAKYGLDMRDLRIKFDPDKNEVTVANIKPKFLSFSDLNYDWKVAEVLEYTVPLIGEKYWQTSKDLEALNSDMKENYRKHINEEVKKGPVELEWVLTPLKKQVAGVLEMLLGAQGRKIKIVEKFDDSFKMLSDFQHEDEN